MTWIADHWLVLVLFGLYTAMIVRHAIVGNRRTHTTVDYYVGGRAMGGVALGISFFATYSSTNSFVGFAGKAYDYGAPWLLLAPIAVIFSLVAWAVVAPRLRVFTERLDSVTIPDFIGFRFQSEPARIAAAVVIILASFLYMTAVFKGIGNLLQVFLHMPYAVAILLVFVIVMGYTAVGGFISVVKTDVVQGVLMVIAAIVLFGGTVAAAGGIDAIAIVRSTPVDADLFRWDAAMPFPLLLGIIVAGTMKFMVDPRQLSRFYALEDHRATRNGMLVSTGAFLFVYSLLVPIGLYAHRVIPTRLSDTDLVVPTLLNDPTVFSPAAGAFLLVAMVAAAMSSLDSVLLVVASTAERDLVGRLVGDRTDTQAIRHTRWYVAGFAAVTAVLALNPPGGIVSLTAFSGALYAACFFPAILLGLYWRRGTGTAVLTSFAVGMVTLLVWKHLPIAGNLHQVFAALILSTAAYVGVSRLGPTDNPAVARLFDAT